MESGRQFSHTGSQASNLRQYDGNLNSFSIDGGLRLYLKDYRAGMVMPKHEHAEWRYCLVLQGSYTDEVLGDRRTRRASHLALHPADEPHQTVFHSASTCFHLEFGHEWRRTLLCDAAIPQHPASYAGGRLPLIAREIYREFKAADACSPTVIQGLAYELAGWTARVPGDPVAVDSRAMERARSYLQDSFRGNVEIRSIAAAVGLHPVQFSREFKRAYGLTPGEWVRRLRVEYVRQNLDRADSLAALALDAGFADQSHMTRVFRRYTGKTPSALLAPFE
jgi:AraC family transcriptional regulator